MAFGFKKTPRIYGHEVPGPRPTLWALVYLLGFVGLPVLTLCLLLDVLLFLAFHVGLGRCYALLCLLM